MATISHTCVRADEQTRRVQEELRKRSLFFGDVDGQKTRELGRALQHYQERKSFPATGELDAATLHSLGLAPDPGTAPQKSRASPPNAAWPDVTVLRSDTERRSTPRAPDSFDTQPAASSALPPIMEGPAETSDDARFPPADVRQFIEGYLHDAQTNNVAAEMRYYADPLDYFDHGIVDLTFVQSDVQHYYKRWPERKYTLLDMSRAPVESHADEVLVKFRIRFTVKNDQHAVQGETDNFFILKSAAPKNFKIVSMREQRVQALAR